MQKKWPKFGRTPSSAIGEKGHKESENWIQWLLKSINQVPRPKMSNIWFQSHPYLKKMSKSNSRILKTSINQVLKVTESNFERDL